MRPPARSEPLARADHFSPRCVTAVLSRRCARVAEDRKTRNGYASRRGWVGVRWPGGGFFPILPIGHLVHRPRPAHRRILRKGDQVRSPSAPQHATPPPLREHRNWNYSTGSRAPWQDLHTRERRQGPFGSLLRTERSFEMTRGPAPHLAERVPEGKDRRLPCWFHSAAARAPASTADC